MPPHLARFGTHSLRRGRMRPDFGGDVMHEAISYDRYVTAVGRRGLDPVGGSDIYYHSYSTRNRVR